MKTELYAGKYYIYYQQGKITLPSTIKRSAYIYYIYDNMISKLLNDLYIFTVKTTFL